MESIVRIETPVRMGMSMQMISPEIDGSIKHTVICDLFWENVPKCVNNFFLIYL